MFLNIGDKKIPFNQALECYKDKKACKRRFGLSSKEYDSLISAMLKAVKGGALKPQSAQQSQRPARFPVQSYSPQGQDQHATLETFNQSILPNSYAPIQSTQQLAQQFSDAPGPSQGADWYESQTMQEQTRHNQLTNIRNYTQSNQSLFDRRFFQGQIQGQAQAQAQAQGQQMPTSYQIPQQSIPFRFNDSAANRQPLDLADHKIFSRTFDLAQQQIPDRTVERQSVGCRRTSTPMW